MVTLSVVTIIISTAAFSIVYAVLERLLIVAPLPDEVANTVGLDVGITLGVCLLGLLLALAFAVRLGKQIVRTLAAV